MDPNESVTQLGEKIGVVLKSEDISASNRLPSKVRANGQIATAPAVIAVKFAKRAVPEQFYRARKALKDLTTKSLGNSEEKITFIMKALNCITSLCSRDVYTEESQSLKYLWTNGGKIFMKDQIQGSKIIQILNVNNVNDLHKIGAEMFYTQVLIPKWV